MPSSDVETSNKPASSPFNNPAIKTQLLSRSRLESLPAEIRSKIFRYVLLMHADDTSSSGLLSTWPLPDITGASKQLRAETLPIFFGNHNFEAHIERDFSSPVLLPWLRALASLPAGQQHLRGILRLKCVGNKLERKKRLHIHKDSTYRFKPNVHLWNSLILALKSSGLHPAQILWPRLSDEDLVYHVREQNIDVLLEQWLLDRYVLVPLLKKHGFYAEEAWRGRDMWEVMFGNGGDENGGASWLVGVSSRVQSVWMEVFWAAGGRCVGSREGWVGKWEREEKRLELVERWTKVLREKIGWVKEED